MKIVREHIFEEEFRFMKGKSKEKIRESLKNIEPRDQLIKAVNNGIFWLVKELIEEKGVNPTYAYNLPIERASEKGFLDIVKYLMTYPEVDPSDDGDNYSIRWAILEHHLDVAKELLKDPRVDPSHKNNYTLNELFRYSDMWNNRNMDYIEDIKFMLQDKRVLDKLTPDQIRKLDKLKQLKLL